MREERLDGTHVAVVGLGESGAAAARLSSAKGGKTYVSDLRSDAKTRTRGDGLRAIGVDVDVGRHDERRIAAADVVVVSPGIPPDVPLLAGLRARSVRWISELEFAFRFLRAPLIAVTGTNGKTTTAALTAHLMRTGGTRVALGGNIGARYGPAASLLAMAEPPPDWFVLEVSSFQLADVETFRPDIGVLTNLAPDHLDRYETVEEYYADKANLFKNADRGSRWVLPLSEEAERLSAGVPGERLHFDSTGTGHRGSYLDGSTLTLYLDEPRGVLERSDVPLLGRHNVDNALAALLTAALAGAGVDALGEGLRTFTPLPHRLERVLEAEGILWVNDSKATNVAATLSALQSLDRPMVVLLGGVDKGESFHPLRSALRAKARAAVLYGEVAKRLERELAGGTPVRRVSGGFESVVSAAHGLAKPGDIVLLSPGTASFDMFSGYEQRGEAFVALVHKLTGRTH